MDNKNTLRNKFLSRPNAIKKFKKENVMGPPKYLDHKALASLLKEKREISKLNRENIKSVKKGKWN